MVIKKYNLAFLPATPEPFIQYARDLSREALPHSYLLGENSLPHVSSCHFAIETQQISTIWEKVCDLKLPTLTLTFNRKRSKSYANHPQWGGVCWVSLIPDQQDELTRIHWEIAQIIKTPLNAAFADYDPHLTLFNSKEEKTCHLFNSNPKVQPPFQDHFKIALGLIDDVGQITEILYQ